MYKAIIRPVLFLFDPEKVHHLVIFLVKFLHFLPGVPALIRKYSFINDPVLKITVAGIPFENRVGMAAGFDKNASCYNDFSIFGFSFIEIGTVTPVAQPGNPRPRLFRLKHDMALINRMGFNNKGVDNAALNLEGKRRKIVIGGNIGKNTATLNEVAVDDYYRCFMRLYDAVDYFVVNISCPNIKDMDKLQDQASLRKILHKLTEARREKQVYRPIFLKISPDITFKQIDGMLEIYRETGLDGIIATNTTTDRHCLDDKEGILQRIGPGGLSGKPLKERSIEIVRYICKQSNGNIPVIGVGGIMNESDAVEMIKAGASLVQIYTGFVYNGPFIVRKMNRAIAGYLRNKKNTNQ